MGGGVYFSIKISTTVDKDIKQNKLDEQKLLTSLLNLPNEMLLNRDKFFIHFDDTVDLILLISFEAEAILIHKVLKNSPRPGLARKCAILRLDKELQRLACKI